MWTVFTEEPILPLVLEHLWFPLPYPCLHPWFYTKTFASSWINLKRAVYDYVVAYSISELTALFG